MKKSEIAGRRNQYEVRIKALDAAILCVKAYEFDEMDYYWMMVYEFDEMDEVLTLETMRAEYQVKLDELSTSKEYMVNFEGGGWNTTHATNDEDALANAKAEFTHSKVKSVTLATKSGIDAAMRSFY